VVDDLRQLSSILIRLLVTIHCRAATRHAAGVMTGLPDRMDTSAASSRIQRYTDSRLRLG
jgi:hypothetical protein